MRKSPVNIEIEANIDDEIESDEEEPV